VSDEHIYDTIMIGAGPSAMAAAIYTTREDIDTVLYERAVVGGLAAVTDQIDNYPAFPDGIDGIKLSELLETQAKRFGAHFEYGDISVLRDAGEYKEVVVDGVTKRARTVLIATGSDYKKTGAPGEAEFYGRGVHYCATCDGAFYRDKKLAVVGGGNSGVQETIFLTRYASHIDLLVRSTIKASEILQRDLQKYVDSGKVTIHLNTTVAEIVASDGKKVSSVRILQDGVEDELVVDGIFVFVGLLPNTGFLKNSGVELDERGLVKTDINLETSLKGVFASGDVRSGATMQIASAVGEGATAALNIREHLDEAKRN
jgi:thioredoxin reductase (NADPH)